MYAYIRGFVGGRTSRASLHAIKVICYIIRVDNQLLMPYVPISAILPLNMTDVALRYDCNKKAERRQWGFYMKRRHVDFAQNTGENKQPDKQIRRSPLFHQELLAT